MKKISTWSALFTAVLLITVRCSLGPDSIELKNNKNNPNENPSGRLGSNITAIYSAFIADTKLNLKLKLEDQNNRILLNRIDVLDLSEGYRLEIENRIKDIASNILSTSDNIDIEMTISSIQELIDNYAAENNNNGMDKEEVQGLFYYLSAFKTIKRYNKELETNKAAELKCTAYNGYIVGLSPFNAKEDLIINTQKLKEYLASGKATKIKQPEANVVIEILNEYKLPEITFAEMEKISSQERIRQKSKALRVSWPEGGDCGCCGNYVGQCYYVHGICYLHDYFCQQCEPRWFCFSGCRPTPC